MFDSHFRIAISDNHHICVSTLNKETLDDSLVDGLGDDFGYFVYETESGDIVDILAKCATYEAALRLIDLFGSKVLKAA